MKTHLKWIGITLFGLILGSCSILTTSIPTMTPIPRDIPKQSYTPVRSPSNNLTITLTLSPSKSTTFTPDGPTATLFLTPDIPNWGSTPVDLDSYMPMTLSCHLLPAALPDPGKVTWRGLTVGISTFEDVKQTVASANKEPYHAYFWDTVSGNFQVFTSDDVGVDTCFINGKLAAMNILTAKEFRKTLSQLITEYGNPDRVIWGNTFYERTLIWPEEGLLIVVSEYAGQVIKAVNVLLFSPIPRCQFEQSWLYQSLPKEGKPFGGDVLSYTIPADVEDPWAIEKGLSDCPTEVKR